VLTSSSDLAARRREIVYKILALLSTIFAIRYFAWRVTDTVSAGALWFFILFFVAEIIGFGEVLLFYLTTWKRTKRTPPPAPANRTVDVFIPTYNEPAEMLRDTVVASLAMRYPHKTYILDDGRRIDVKRLAEELGCEYLTRPDNAHAKAGNLNAALKHTSGEFVVVLDADHIPSSDLIEQLLGFFTNPKTALVQTNQDFFNLDSFQHATDWNSENAWQQQELFFNVIQPGKDALDAAIYCGSPAMIRREALADVGYFATETITEDMHTGMRMQMKGWEVIYYNRTVARGLAPQTYLAYNTQWHRWGVGAMQVLRAENPIFRGKLSFKQRLAYLSSFYFYWTSYQKLFFLLIPGFCVLTGIFPYSGGTQSFLSHFLPYLITSFAAAVVVQHGFLAFVNTERFNLVKLGAMLRSVGGLMNFKMKFKVTPKAKSEAAPISTLLPYVVLLVLLMTAAIWGTQRAIVAGDSYHAWAFAVNAFFALYYFYLLAPSVVMAMRRQELRASYRFPRQLEAPVHYHIPGAPAQSWPHSYARNMNRFGLSITIDRELPIGTELSLRLQLPTGPINATASVRWTSMFDVAGKKRYAHGLRFEKIAATDQDAIVLYLIWDVAPRHGNMLRLTESEQQRQDRVA
jgi:cellulose synthase (UDP-forming)